MRFDASSASSSSAAAATAVMQLCMRTVAETNGTLYTIAATAAAAPAAYLKRYSCTHCVLLGPSLHPIFPYPIYPSKNTIVTTTFVRVLERCGVPWWYGRKSRCDTQHVDVPREWGKGAAAASDACTLCKARTRTGETIPDWAGCVPAQRRTMMKCGAVCVHVTCGEEEEE